MEVSETGTWFGYSRTGGLAWAFVMNQKGMLPGPAGQAAEPIALFHDLRVAVGTYKALVVNNYRIQSS